MVSLVDLLQQERSRETAAHVTKPQIPGPLSSRQISQGRGRAKRANVDTPASWANQSRTGRHAEFHTASRLPAVSLVRGCVSSLGIDYSWGYRQNSSLTQIPTSLRPIFDPMRRLLAPTAKVLDIFRRSFESGSQREFARRLLEKSRSPEPFILGRRLCKKAWEMISGPPDAKSDI